MKSQAHRRVGLACGSLGWIVLGCAAAATAVPFAGGTGEPNDPYQIATAEQLISIGSDPNLLSRHFVLVADIDLDPNLPGGKVFTKAIIAPSLVLGFSGSLDGAGHVIRNLNINAFFDVGLFGYVAASGIVKNLGLENADITGSLIGGLAAFNEGTLSSCHSTGSVTSEGSVVGGLVGDNYGTVSSCYSIVSVTGEGFIVGGLAGWNRGTIVLCSSTGSVTGESMVGGLVGDNEGIVSSCYSIVSVTGERGVGGLVGVNGPFGTLTCCYSTGDVTSTEWVPGGIGGLLGRNEGGMVTSCYSTSRVAGLAEVAVGGLAGLNGTDTGQIAGSYYLAPSDGGGPDNGLGMALDAGQMRKQGSFAGFDFWGTKADGLRDDWFMPADLPPVLAWQTDQTGLQSIPDLRGLTLEEAMGVLEQAGLVLATEVQTDYDRSIPQGLVLRTYPPSYTTPGGTIEVVVSKGPYEWTTNPGDGTEANPYQIQTANQLESLTDNPGLWSKHFVLTADIDLAGRTYSKALIAPDVDDSIDGFQGTAFTGSFDGQGFKILNLGIATAANDYLGLFGFIAKGALVRQVDLVNARIEGQKGSYYVGTVAGYNAGTIADCYVRGAVNGHSGTEGQVAGGNSGKIENCDAAVSGAGMAKPG